MNNHCAHCGVYQEPPASWVGWRDLLFCSESCWRQYESYLLNKMFGGD